MPNLRKRGQAVNIVLRTRLAGDDHSRIIEPILSSTCVVKVATDDGASFLEGMGNPQ